MPPHSWLRNKLGPNYIAKAVAVTKPVARVGYLRAGSRNDTRKP
jgi:hypothetical protein